MFSFSGCIWKKKNYLLVVWATQSMFHVVANANSPTRDGRLLAGQVTVLPPEVRRGAWGEAWPPQCKVGRGGCLPLPLLGPLPATISFNHCRQRGTLVVVHTEGREAGCGAWNHNCPAEPKLATMSLFPCHSVYLEFALHALWVYALFICSLKSHAWKRKERNSFTWCCSLTWEESWCLQDAEIIFIHSDAIFPYHSIRSLYPIAINNRTDMFLMYSTATCTAYGILEENGIRNKPISYSFLQSCS